jgi:hypothetical protein
LPDGGAFRRRARPLLPKEILMSSYQDIASRPMFRFLILLTFAVAVSSQGWTAMYTNFAVEVVNVTGEQTGIIHAMREVPGLLSIGVLPLLLVMREHTLASLSVFCAGLGTLATGFFPSFQGVLLTAMVMSLGFHYYEATVQSLTLQYFSVREAPLVMGKLRSATAAGSLFIGLLIFSLVSLLHLPYTALFIIAGSLGLAGGLWGLCQKPEREGMPIQRRNMVLRKKYWLYYVLTGLSGARRHIFTTFSIFLLVQHFRFSVQEMLALFVINNIINWFLNPLIGKAINSVGERKLLSLKYLVLAFIFVAYCTTDSKMLVAGLYVVEQLFTNFSMAIRSFFQKIGDPKDIAPSMAVGQTVNHITAVILPVAGGILWMIDYRIPFVIGIGVALLAFCMVQFIRCPAPADALAD